MPLTPKNHSSGLTTGSIEAIVLAGGLGTRLRSVVSELPKCMAPVAGRPFLHYVTAYLQQQGVESFIFSLGYMHEKIEEFIAVNYPGINARSVVEASPLGTGGAIRLACSETTEKHVIVVNGDTFFQADLRKLFSFHKQQDAACTLALKPMKNFDRYGAVEINQDGYIQEFREKQFLKEGLINGGIYALSVDKFLANDFPQVFSFEKDYLEKYCATEKMMGLVQDEYFIDIGIPGDFDKANREFEQLKK